MENPVGGGQATLDFRDWLVVALVVSAWLTATIYLFANRSNENFATWGAFSATTIGAYHWIVYRDDKTPDSQ